MSAHPLHGKRHRGPRRCWTARLVDDLIVGVYELDIDEKPVSEPMLVLFCDHFELVMPVVDWDRYRASDHALRVEWLASYLNRRAVPLHEDAP